MAWPTLPASSRRHWFIEIWLASKNSCNGVNSVFINTSLFNFCTHKEMVFPKDGFSLDTAVILYSLGNFYCFEKLFLES